MKFMSKIDLDFGDKCFMFVLARSLEHKSGYHHVRVYKKCKI